MDFLLLNIEIPILSLFLQGIDLGIKNKSSVLLLKSNGSVFH